MLKLTRIVLIVLLSLALPIWLIACACECGEDGDDDSATGDDDDAVGDDDDAADDDDDDDDDAADDDDDAVGDDDDTAAFDGAISGTLELDGGITLTSTPPHTVGIGLYLAEDWSPVGPTGEPVSGVSMDDVAGFPVAFTAPYINGEEVYVAAFVDEDGSGSGAATSGDIVGFSAAAVPVPSEDVTITLIMAMP